eukprot:2047968-Prymnesium_polylepis.1
MHSHAVRIPYHGNISSHTWNGETQLTPCPVELGARLFRGVTIEIEVRPFWQAESRKERGSVAVIRRDESRKGR